MKKNEPVITFDHMEDEKDKSTAITYSKRIDYFEIAMFIAEEMLAIIILLSMIFLL